MPPDPNALSQFVQNIPPDQLDHIHQALGAIRAGQLGGQPLDTSKVDPAKLSTLWDAVHSHVAARNQAEAEKALPEPSLGDKVSALGSKLWHSATDPGTAGATQMEFAQKHPVASALLGPIGGAMASGAVMKPVMDIQKLEAPGYAEDHPFMHGVAGGASGMTSPFVAGTAGVGGEAEAIAPRLSAWATRVFTAQMAMGNYQQAKTFHEAYKRGDKTAMWSAAGEMAATAPFTIMGVLGSGPRGKKTDAQMPKAPPEPISDAGEATATLSGEQVPRPPNVSKIAQNGSQGPAKASVETPVTPEAVHQAAAAQTAAKPNPLSEMFKPRWQRDTEARANTTFELGMKEAAQHYEDVKIGKTDPQGMRGTDELVDPTDFSKGYKTPKPATELSPEAQATQKVLDAVKTGREAPEVSKPKKEVLPTSIDLTAKIEAGAKGPKTPEEKSAWAAQRADLMTERAAVTPAEAVTRSPMDKVRAAVEQTVKPQSNYKGDPAVYRQQREDVLGRVIDAHAEDGRIGPEDLRSEATKSQSRADAIQYHLDVQGAKSELQGARKESGVERIKVSSYAEPGEKPTGSGIQFADAATTARRTVLDMLGGYNLTAKRLFDAETGKVERNFRDNPLSQEASDFARDHQTELGRLVKEAQASKQFPDEAKLQEMEGHVTAIEAATGMKMVYSGKGSSLDGFDPSRAALNELVGRGSKSHLGNPLERGPVVRDRLLDAANLLNQHADRLSGAKTEVPQPTAPVAAVQAPVMTETPVSTPTSEAPNPRIGEIDKQLNNLRDTFQEAQAAAREGGPPVSKETVQEMMGKVKELRAEKAKLSEKGAISANLLGGSVGVRLRDWFDANREDTTSIPGKLQDVADRVKFGLGRLSSILGKLTSAFSGKQPYRDFDRVTGDFDLHMQQTAEIREQFDRGLKQLVPEKIRRIGISNYIEAGGDPAVLAAREAGAKDRFKRGYQVAQNLSPLEKAAADSLRLSYDDLAQRAMQAGVLHTTLGDYVNHVYKQLPAAIGRAINSLSSGTLKSNPGFAMKRVWESFYEAEKQGAIPEKDIGWLHSRYVDAMERAIASRAYVRGGTESIEADGRKTFSVSGLARKIGEVEQDPALLVRPHGSGPNSEDDISGYRQINHSSMRQWQWVAKDADTGQNTFMQGDLLVHPDRYAEVKAMLESSKLRDSGVAQFALKTTATIKNSVFLMTGFHPLTLSFHGVERGAVPGFLDKLDIQNNQIQQVGVAHGLKLHDYDAAYTFGKSMEETNLFNSIPGFGKYIQAYQHWVFNDLQPRLKVTAFRKGMEANMKTYGGKLSAEQIAAKTALEVNNAFGGQNWQKMGVSKTAQDVFKLGFMAPDFLKSRMAYTAQSFRPFTHLEQTKSMWLRGGLGMYMAARVLNAFLNNGDAKMDPRDAFTVYHAGQKYTLRTAQQDFVGLLQNPHGFMTARVAPLGQTAVEAYTGRNEQGFERGAKQQVQDFLARTPQLTVQQYLNSPDASWWDSFRSSMGIHSKEAHTQAEELALQFRAQGIPRGEQGDEERERLKTLHSLRRLGTQGRTDEFEKTLSDGIDRGVLAQSDADKLYDNIGAEYLPQLVRGLDATHAMEVFRQASGDERDQIADVVQDKLDRALDSDAVSQKVKDRISKEADELFK